MIDDTIGGYLFSFSLILGVQRFGAAGVLFGPFLVCVLALSTDAVSASKF